MYTLDQKSLRLIRLLCRRVGGPQHRYLYSALLTALRNGATHDQIMDNARSFAKRLHCIAWFRQGVAIKPPKPVPPALTDADARARVIRQYMAAADQSAAEYSLRHHAA